MRVILTGPLFEYNISRVLRVLKMDTELQVVSRDAPAGFTSDFIKSLGRRKLK